MSFKTTNTWGIGDIQAMFLLTDKEAEKFMEDNERAFQDRMSELGFEVWEVYGQMAGLTPADNGDDRNNEVDE